jgi:hypothetical protein
VAVLAALFGSSITMIRKSVAEILDHHVTFELEAIDRMYLNAYVPSLQTGAGFVYFLKTQLGVRVPSTVMVAPMSYRFVAALKRFVETEGVDLVTFKKGQRKDDIAKKYLAAFQGEEGVLFVGRAQEKASVFRTEKRRDARGTYPWIIRSTTPVSHYYVYLVDRDFGPLFIKFCTYFPYAHLVGCARRDAVRPDLCAWRASGRVAPNIDRFAPSPTSPRTPRCRTHHVPAGGPTCCLKNLTQLLTIHRLKTPRESP